MFHSSSKAPFSGGAMKSFLLGISLLLLVSTAAFSQKLLIETDTQEGQLLQQIDDEANEVKKQALLEQFPKTFPNHEERPRVFSQTPSLHITHIHTDKS